MRDWCPICDKRMEVHASYYRDAECPEGHYREHGGNYHLDVWVGDKCFT
jgi:hypothetical protein